MARKAGTSEVRGDSFDAAYILYAWNQSPYAAEAVRSALAQRGCRLDILISDDASTDGTFDVIREAARDYSGPHRVRIRQSPRNLGIDHFPKLLAMTGCDIAIHAHGDDIALPDRASSILRVFRDRQVSVVSSNAILIDTIGSHTGELVKERRDCGFSPSDLIDKTWRPHMTGALLAFRREVYRKFPWLDSRYLARGHDSLVPWRGALLDGFHWIGEPLLKHRMHDGQWRHRFFDNADKYSRKETVVAQQLSVARARQRDVDHLLRGASVERAARLSAIREALDAKAVELFDEWLDLREGLIRDGLRPVWDRENSIRNTDDAPRGPQRGIARLLQKMGGRR